MLSNSILKYKNKLITKETEKMRKSGEREFNFIKRDRNEREKEIH
jgi:hypothetical protein